MSERMMLMRLVQAAEHVEPDWDDALRRAGSLRRTRRSLPARRVVVLVAVFLTVIYAVAAVAADSPRSVVYWLYDRSPDTYPQTQVPTLGEWFRAGRAEFELVSTATGQVPQPAVRLVPVLHGESAGRRWEMQVFLRDIFSKEQLHVGFHPGGTPGPLRGTDTPGFGNIAGGYPVHGLQPPGTSDLHWVGLTLTIPGVIEAAGGGTGPKYLFGPAAPNVRQVDLQSNDGTVIRVPTFPGPNDLGVHVRLWVAVLRLDHLVHTIVPRDANGEALEYWNVPAQ
jgi:hypothetical protein